MTLEEEALMYDPELSALWVSEACDLEIRLLIYGRRRI